MAETAEYPTSLMIKNIPSRALAKDVTGVVDKLGFQGMYDFFYLPDRLGRKGCPVNHGYAFINFKSSKFSAEFAAYLEANSVTLRCSPKTLSVSRANVQGLEALLSYSDNSKGKERFVENPVTRELVSLEQSVKLQEFTRTMRKAKTYESYSLKGFHATSASQDALPVAASQADSEEDDTCQCDSTVDSLPSYLMMNGKQARAVAAKTTIQMQMQPMYVYVQ
eukprot:TRINITY_DN31358_c0_g1_i2.p1 TRINITY_DN31358_c0_g1~~TRINITY_DN31358_c0_g1_i2.p1  ORF type:complete len:222 (-),score=50.73 TRINITY_DN31358_c0_g1_i2:411-1076(-)